MDEQPNVNNLNGVPNFGEGMGEMAPETPMESEMPEMPETPEEPGMDTEMDTEMAPEMPADESEVAPMPEAMPEGDLPADN